MSVNQDAIKFIFEKDYNSFSKESLKEIEDHIRQSDEITSKVQSVTGAYWFELEEEYLEENELPIQADVTFVTPEGTDVKAQVYVFFSFESGKLTDEVDLEVGELEALGYS